MVTPSQLAIIETTYPSMKEAQCCAKELVEALRLAACCHIYPSIRSVYMWEGKLCDEEEVVMRIKTDKQLIEKVTSYIKSRHSYTNPEVTVIICDHCGSDAYESWVVNHVKHS